MNYLASTQIHSKIALVDDFGVCSVGANQPRFFIMFKNIYVKKLCSLNPDEYKFITLEEAIDKYKIYCVCCTKYAMSDYTHIYDIKSFQEWLETEI